MIRLTTCLLLLCALSFHKADAQKVYTLRECLEEGFANNYSLRISRNLEEIARNNATRANAGQLPEVSASLSYTLGETSTDVKSRTGSNSHIRNLFNQWVGAGVDVNYTIFDGFNSSSNYKRLKELELKGEMATRIEIEDFIAGLAAEYYNLVQQKLRLKNFLYAVKLSKERLRIVEARYSIGSFSRLDYLQAKVDFNADSANYINQQQQVAASQIALNELMATQDVSAPVIISDTAINVNNRLDYNDLLASTLASNSSLLSASQQIRIAELNYKMVASRDYPALRLNAGYDYGLNLYGSGATLRSGSWGADAGLTMSFTLWDGKRKNQKRNAHIEILNSELAREQLELTLRADLANMWQAYLNNLRLLSLERDNLVAAYENYDIAKDRYMLGDLPGIDMREAQKSLLDAQERILTAEYNAKITEISLMQISGKIASYFNED